MPARARLDAFLSSFLSARRLADTAALETLLDPNAVCRIAGDRRLMPLAGHYEGRADVLLCLRNIEAALACDEIAFSDLLGSRTDVSLRWSATLSNRGTGRSIPTSGAAHLRFRDERLAACSLYFDTAAIAALTGWAARPHSAQDPDPVVRDHVRIAGIGASRADIDAFFVSLHESWHDGRFSDVVESHFHPAARAMLGGAGVFEPFSGTHVGHAAILRAIRRLMGEFERLRAHIHDILVEGNRITLMSRLRLRHRRTRRNADVESCDVYVLDLDGKIVEWVAYCDTGLLSYLAEDRP